MPYTLTEDARLWTLVALSCLAFFVSLFALVISIQTYRLNLRQFRANGHDVELTVRAQQGGVWEMGNRQPVDITLSIRNRGRGKVSLMSARIVTAPWMSVTQVLLPFSLSNRPSEGDVIRLDSHDASELTFNSSTIFRETGWFLRGSSFESNFKWWGKLRNRVLIRKHGAYPLCVEVELGDGTKKRTWLSKREALILWSAPDARWH